MHFLNLEKKLLSIFWLKACIDYSAVVQIDAALEIDASIISTGLKVSSSVRSSAGLGINFQVLDGQGYDIKIDVPVKEQDFFTMKTEAFATMQTRGLTPAEVPLKPAGKRWVFCFFDVKRL